MSLQWRHMVPSWHLNSLASRQFVQPFIKADIKENIKARVAAVFESNLPVTGGFLSQRASNAELVSI